MRVLLMLLVLLPAVASAGPPPKAFSADYEVFQNDQKLGTGRIELRALPDGRWEMSTRSQATEGLFAAAGVQRQERSLLRWTGAVAETVEYQMRQQAAWNTREQRLVVDAAAQRANSTYKGETTALSYRPGLIDKHALTAAIMSDLAAGRTGDLDYPVAERRAVESQRFRTAANVRLQTALGPMRAVRVERVRGDGDARVTKIWFARERGWLPLRIKQYESNGDTLDMRITAIR